MFGLLGRIAAAAVQSVGYSVAYGIEMVWHLSHSRRDKAGETIGKWGKAVTDALVGAFRRR
jgi:hypothetical protein